MPIIFILEPNIFSNANNMHLLIDLKFPVVQPWFFQNMSLSTELAAIDSPEDKDAITNPETIAICL